MIREICSKYLPERQKRTIKSQLSKIKKFVVNRIMSYDGEVLKEKLRSWEVLETDTLMVHANFKPDSGFKGSPADVVNALVDLVGVKGNLMMVSIPFRGTAHDYLAKNNTFNIRKTISMMGLITELFRRHDGVFRSFHPTHPVLSLGRDSAWLTADHEKCLYPCGLGTPFDKLRQLNGKILFFDVDFTAITFFHYLEDITKDKVPFDVYYKDPFFATCYDEKGDKHIIKTYVFNKNLTRNVIKLEAEMLKRKMVKKGKVGNSNFILVNTSDVVSCYLDMVESGNYPYD